MRCSRLPALVLSAVTAASTAFSQEAPPPAEPPADAGRYVLDEYNVDLYGGRGTSKIALGITFGDVFEDEVYLQVGPRLSWVDYRKDGPDEAAIAAGAHVAVGWRPGAWVSPIGILALDVPIGAGDRAKLQTTIGVGARVRVSPELREHFVLTFALFHTRVIASGAQPDFGDTGVALLFAPVLYDRR